MLDTVLDEEGVRPEAVLPCHLDPSGEDPDCRRPRSPRWSPAGLSTANPRRLFTAAGHR
ncbi:hypothetical protein [Pseudonocardia oroxyli]|uniref:hypothetical protein n=1 Tax=Pseudonocardia oroxyli TaxID=366584 RepID=UPI001FE1DC4C|nr:hypothetical protein [Pseudonocardia oroxyli]